MTTYLVGYWNPDLTNSSSNFIPIGVVVRDDEGKKEHGVRVVKKEEIPGYNGGDVITKELLNNLREMFKWADASSRETSLSFSKVGGEGLSGSFQEQADELYRREVLLYYEWCRRN